MGLRLGRLAGHQVVCMPWYASHMVVYRLLWIPALSCWKETPAFSPSQSSTKGRTRLQRFSDAFVPQPFP